MINVYPFALPKQRVILKMIGCGISHYRGSLGMYRHHQLPSDHLGNSGLTYSLSAGEMSMGSTRATSPTTTPLIQIVTSIL